MKRLQIIGYNATLRGPIYFLQYCNDLGSDFATAAVAGASPSGTIKSEASVYKGAITRNWEGLKEVGGGHGRSVGWAKRLRFYEGGDDLLIYWY